MLEARKTPSVAVVIPAHKRQELVRNAILSIFNQDLDKTEFELVVVDSSPDDSVEKVVQEVEPLATCRFHFRRKDTEGPGPSRNLGVASTTAPIVAFMDSDCVATPGWLRAGLAGFEEGVGIVQGAVIPDPAKPLTVFSHTLLVDHETYCYQTANVFYRRECFEALGGFIKNWMPRARRNVGGEDVDMAWRVKRKGWQARFREDALVYHDVVPVPIVDWMWIRSMVVLPWLLARYPEIKPWMYWGIFYDKAQALLTLGLVGTLLTPVSLWALLGWIPYWVYRSSESSRTLKGPLRLLRPGFYLLRDMTSFCLLVLGSVRARKILL
jgi:glycosyltransferase involved in cell wall biosynthesis